MKEGYNAYQFAKSLGFTDAEALAMRDADATNIRRVAKAKGLLPSGEQGKPVLPAPTPTKPKRERKSRTKGKGSS